jgi:hypothetical protein
VKLIEMLHNLISLKVTTFSTVRYIMYNLNNSQSKDIYRLNLKLIKSVIEKGVFPSVLKKSIKFGSNTKDAILIISITTQQFRYSLLLFSSKLAVKSRLLTHYALRIMDQLFKSYVFTRMLRSQSTLQRQL